MKEYYSFLFITTWPAIALLFLILTVILTSLFFNIKTEIKRGLDTWIVLVLFVKTLVSLGLLLVYLKMFMLYYPDWFASPGILLGEVHGKTSFSSVYLVEIIDGIEQKSFYVDKATYLTVQLGDKVDLLYLPNRLEVVRCEVLP